MLQEIIYTNQTNIKKDVSTLLVDAFPENERPPVSIFFKNFEKDNNRLLVFYNEETFIGFTALTFYKDICYIFFLAVTPTFRHQGYGSQILEIVKEKYQNYVLLLAFEEVNPQYPNYQERLIRQKFYYDHGFMNNDLITDEWGVHFQTAYIGKRKVTFEEYKEIFKLGFGVDAEKYLKKAN